MSPTLFLGVKYSQRLDTCVLASYAVACFPFTNKQPVLDYFLSYCRHFKLNETYPERSYDLHFHPLSKIKPGYQIIKELHDSSSESVFVKARQSITLSPLINWSKDVAAVNASIRKDNCLLLLFINESSLPGLSSGHSIVVGHNSSHGLYYFDTARPCNEILQAGPNQIADFGTLGDAYLVTKI